VHFKINDRYYGHHFWLWSLLCTPAFKILRVAGLNPLRAHELTFFALFSLALFMAYRHVRLKDGNKTFFLVFVTITPMLWMTKIMGSEALLYSCMLIAVTFISNKRYDLAAIAISVASTQNAGYMPLAFWISMIYLINSKISASTIIKLLLCLSPLLISPLFYTSVAGTWNPIAKYLVSPSIFNVNLWMFLLLLLDSTQGLIIYMPLLTLAYVIILFHHIFIILKNMLTRNFGSIFTVENITSTLPLAICLVISIMINWNCGRLAVNRYALPLIPFMAYSICSLKPKLLQKIFYGNLVVVLLWFAFSSTGLVNYTWRGGKDVGPLDFGLISKIVLKHTPALYIAFSDESFIEPTLKRDFMPSPFISQNSDLLPVVYHDEEFGARKILANSKSIGELTEYFNFEKSETLRAIQKQMRPDDKPFYVNLPAFRPAGMISLKNFTSDDLRHSVTIDNFPSQIALEQKFSFGLTVYNNTSDKTFPRVPLNLPQQNALGILWSVEKIDNAEEYDTISRFIPLKNSIQPSTSDNYDVEFDLPHIIPGKYRLIAGLSQHGSGDFIPENDDNIFYFEATLPAVPVGDTLYFTSDSTIDQYVYAKDGFSPQESFHRWTEGWNAKIIFNAGDLAQKGLYVKMDISPLPNTKQLVEVVVNKRKSTEWLISEKTSKEIFLPPRREESIYTVELRLPNATSPKKLGLNEDPRILGLAFHSIVFSEDRIM
jgi:hypothetical protein